jgi:glutathione-regulated potassium-efflux system ancillary protein KefF
MALLIHAHPYPNRSRANRSMLAGVRNLPSLEVRSLYDLYPDFGIDVEAEQAALTRAKLVVWQHPMYWYSVPGLLKHWFDQVLSRGWAYGDGGKALHGKHCLWVTTTGGNEQAFSAEGMHAHPLSEFSPVVEQTARFCGMKWLEPFVLHGAHLISEAELRIKVDCYRERVALAMAEVEVD